MADAKDVRVDADTFDDAKCVLEDGVRGFLADARQFGEFVECVRDAAVEFFVKRFAGADEVFCFGAGEGDGDNFFHEGLEVGAGEFFGCRILCVECGGDLVDDFVAHLG